MMHLTDEEKSILAGEKGEALRLALKTLVCYGEAFRAQKFVDISSAHIVAFVPSIAKTYFRILDSLVRENHKVKVPTTVNPKPYDKPLLAHRLIWSKQKYLELQLEKLGIIPDYTCVPYTEENIPKFGDYIAWAESSAILYANSVLGARTNRNSSLIDLLSAVTGKAPYYGLLIDEHRKGEVLVKTDKGVKIDFSALGYFLGKNLVSKIPVIENIPCTNNDLKALGASSASSGSTGIFHVEGVTPEAHTIKDACDGDPKKTILVRQSDIDSLRSNRLHNIDLVIFGCPHLTIPEILSLKEEFKGKRIYKEVWFCTAPKNVEKLKETEVYSELTHAGIKLNSSCPGLFLMSSIFRRRKVLTNSGKLLYYLDGAKYGSLEDCIRVSLGC